MMAQAKINDKNHIQPANIRWNRQLDPASSGRGAKEFHCSIHYNMS